jgi:hypothetical protein
MFGLNKTADDKDSSQVPTHSFYMTFEDEHELSDFSDDEESDECDDGHWSDTDSLCSEFASPLNLSLICSVKQQEELLNFGTWEMIYSVMFEFGIPLHHHPFS